MRLFKQPSFTNNQPQLKYLRALIKIEEKTTKRNKANNLNKFSKSKILKLKQNFPKNQYMFPQTFN